ncbi:3-hydroxyacyl-CoA dehydrogenase [Candidatus Woesearchaeota archaeon]|nr:3-hydroxyacyl-CoA dehydrogenase [Candidatus Woesearchaeota archaeon]
MGNVNIKIPDEVHKQVRVACAVDSITLIEFINNAIKEKLEREKVGKG